MIAVVSPCRTSTSGRASVGMKPCTKALYVSLISRWDSAAIVPNTSELLPEPETPVNTVSRRFGISMLTSLRLLTRAPCTRIRSWLSAAFMTARLATADHPRFSIPDHLSGDRRVLLRTRGGRHLPQLRELDDLPTGAPAALGDLAAGDPHARKRVLLGDAERLGDRLRRLRDELGAAPVRERAFGRRRLDAHDRSLHGAPCGKDVLGGQL